MNMLSPPYLSVSSAMVTEHAAFGNLEHDDCRDCPPLLTDGRSPFSVLQEHMRIRIVQKLVREAESERLPQEQVVAFLRTLF